MSKQGRVGAAFAEVEAAGVRNDVPEQVAEDGAAREDARDDVDRVAKKPRPQDDKIIAEWLDMADRCAYRIRAKSGKSSSTNRSKGPRGFVIFHFEDDDDFVSFITNDLIHTIAYAPPDPNLLRERKKSI